MKTRHVVIVVLGVAALVLALKGIGQTAKGQTLPEGEVEATLFLGGQPGFIVVEGGPAETVTVQNPRGDEDLVFYITAVLGKGCAGGPGIYNPPELQHPATEDTAWQPSTTNWTAGMLLPLVTTIDVQFADAGGTGCVVLAGYYSRRTPHIASVGGE